MGTIDNNLENINEIINEKNLKSEYLDRTEQVNKRILAFLEQTGYDLIQSNGQRRYAPPPSWTGTPPTRGSEIFIGKLPRDCFEDELVPAFERVGKIYEMRLMMDFSGLNRGYGFVKYLKVEDAHRAVLLMDDYEIRPGNRIGVSKSVDNCRLFVGGINFYKSAAEVQEELSKIVEGITRVIMYPSIENKMKNRGFVFVEFENHRMAAMARRKLIPGALSLWGQQIVVDWAEPEPEVDPKIMSKIRKLYVRNLAPDMSEEFLENVLLSLTAASNILRIKKINDYAFIHFRTRGSAEFVLMKLNGMVLLGSQIEVTWARPPMYSKTRNNFPQKMSLCLSLPPRLRNQSRINYTTNTVIHSDQNYFNAQNSQYGTSTIIPSVTSSHESSHSSEAQCQSVTSVVPQYTQNLYVPSPVVNYPHAQYYPTLNEEVSPLYLHHQTSIESLMPITSYGLPNQAQSFYYPTMEKHHYYTRS